MKMRNLAIAVVLIAVVAGAYFFIRAPGTESMVSVKFYDKYKKPIYSVVDGTQGVFYVSIITTVTNTGEITFDTSIIETSPTELTTAYSGATIQTVAPGASIQWESELIDITIFEGTTQRFYVKVQGDYTYGGESYSLFKEGWVDLAIEPDPVAGMDVTIESSVGGTGGGSEPEPEPNGGTCLVAGTSCDPVASECCYDCYTDVTGLSICSPEKYINAMQQNNFNWCISCHNLGTSCSNGLVSDCGTGCYVRNNVASNFLKCQCKWSGGTYEIGVGRSC